MGTLKVQNIQGLGSAATVDGVSIPAFNVHMHDPLQVDGNLSFVGSTGLPVPHAGPGLVQGPAGLQQRQRGGAAAGQDGRGRASDLRAL